MVPSLRHYTDALKNPYGIFQTLKGLYPFRDDKDELSFSVAGNVVCFNVYYEGFNARLYCFLDNAELNRNKYVDLSKQMSKLNCRFLQEWSYLEDEMLVYDDLNNYKYCDVVIQHTPEGVPMDEFLTQCCRRTNTAEIWSLMDKIFQMSQDFSHERLIHGNIKPNHIYVNEECCPTMTYFRESKVMDELSLNEQQSLYLDYDNMSIASIIIVLYVLSFRPNLYFELGQAAMFRRESILNILHRLLDSDIAKQIPPFIELAQMIISSNGWIKNRIQLHEAISNLIIFDVQNIDKKHMSIEIKQDFEWTGKENDGLLCVKNRNGEWYYLNNEHKMAFDQTFEWAGDFSKERAVVVKMGRCGLIDTQGRYVIEPCCDDITWYGEEEIAHLTINSDHSLCDINGAKIDPDTTQYDMIGIFADGLFLAQLNQKFGFIDKNGAQVIPFIYDDACGFCNGTAIVKIECDCFEIDTNGEVVATHAYGLQLQE